MKLRIGGITKDNHKDYLKLLGVENTKDLDEFWGEDEKSKGRTIDNSHEAYNKRRVAAGHEDGMLIRDGDTSWRKIVPVSDEIKNVLIATVNRQFITNAN